MMVRRVAGAAEVFRYMDIAIISRGEALYSTRRLVETTRDHGHRPIVLNPAESVLLVANGESCVMQRGVRLPHLDIVVPRIGPNSIGHGLALVRHLEHSGSYVLNSSDAILRARDKLRCLQALGAADIRVPRTAFASQVSDIDRLIGAVGGLPVVIKLLNSSQGMGVMLAENRRAVRSALDTFQTLGQSVLVQEFVSDARGDDIRALVVGDSVIAAIRRHAAPGDFRANIHRGGTAEPAKITRELQRVALAAKRSVRLDIAGVDMLETADGFLVLEVNVSPGLEAIESTTGTDVASRIIEHAIEQHHRYHR